MNQYSRAAVAASASSSASSSGSHAASGARRPARIAIVSAEWHRDIVEQATNAIRAALAEVPDQAGPPDEFRVPGAFEIPLMVRRLAQSGRYDGIIACAFVVNGGIYRHEFVSSAVIDGLMRVQLDTDTPVFSAVLTPRDFHEHDTHRRFFLEHFVEKGAEVTRACLGTLAALRRVESV